jgi:hypothetical protein
VPATQVSQRQLNRSLLARQLLLEREQRGVLETVEHLVGMQAQEPPDPYVGCWTRLRDFRPDELGEPLALLRRLGTYVVADLADPGVRAAGLSPPGGAPGG